MEQKKQNRNYINVMLAALVVLSAGYLGYKALFDSYRPVKAIVSGQVSWTETEGASLSEGTAVVRIYTPTGEITAARSSGEGRLHEVKVKVGDNIASGQIVADIK